MQKYVKPREGLIVRDPVQFSPLPADGGWVDWNGHSGRYWRRRVSCGDVSICEPPVLGEAEPVTTGTTSTMKRKKEDKK